MGFVTADQAFERRGYVKGLRRAKEEVDNLYSYTHESVINNVQKPSVANASGADNVGGRFNLNGAGNAAGFKLGESGIESESATPSGPAY